MIVFLIIQGHPTLSLLQLPVQVHLFFKTTKAHPRKFVWCYSPLFPRCWAAGVPPRPRRVLYPMWRKPHRHQCPSFLLPVHSQGYQSRRKLQSVLPRKKVKFPFPNLRRTTAKKQTRKVSRSPLLFVMFKMTLKNAQKF